jgi:hypothetical protein
MAEVQLNLGASLDIASGQEIENRFDSLEEKMFGRRSHGVIYLTKVAAGNVPASNAEFYLDLGFPPVGRIWNLTGLTVVGNDDSTALANAKVAIYFGDSQQPALSSVKIPGLVVPSFQSFSDKVLWCHSSENIVAGVSGTAAAGSQVLVLAHIVEYVEADVVAHTGR